MRRRIGAIEPINLEIKKGATESFVIYATQDGEYYDLTDVTLYFTVKIKSIDPDEDAIIKKDVTEHLDPKKGQTIISLTSEDTNKPAKSYYWDLWMKDEDDCKIPLAEGQFLISESITRRVRD